MNGMKLDFNSFAKNIEKDMDRRTTKALGEAASFIHGKIKEATPVGETGNLKRSLKKQKWKRSIGVGFTKPDGSHAHLVEYGHDLVKNGVKVGHVEAHPFFAPTWEANAPELKKKIKEAYADI